MFRLLYRREKKDKKNIEKRMFKLSVTLTFLLISAMLFSYIVAENAEESDDEISEFSPEEYELILREAIKRSMLAKMLSEEPAYEGRIEKRYPKWRSGSTSDRVSSIHLSKNRLNPSAQWANNLKEKSRLYDRIHG